MKKCKTCGEIKPLDQYYPTSQRSAYPNAAPEKYLQPYCKACYVTRRQEYKKNHPDKYKRHTRDYKRRKKYGLTREQIAEIDLITACEVCGSDWRLVIDHCHDTMTFRGVICNKCNLSIGHADESAERLSALANYLIERGS